MGALARRRFPTFFWCMARSAKCGPVGNPTLSSLKTARATAYVARTGHTPRVALAARAYWPPLLMRAAAAAHTASSCEPVPPEQPIAPMTLPFSVSGIPPRDAMTSSRLNTYL